MTRYLIGRVLQALVVLFGVSVVVFGMLHILPGGPARAVLGPKATLVAIHTFEREYGLLKPLPVQYFDWLGQVFRGNLGFSYKLNQSVDTLLAANLPRTVALVGTAAVLAIMIALPLGVYQAVRRNKLDDYALTGASFLFYSMPTFLLGLILILLFTTVLGWFPANGPTGEVPLWDQLANMVLPIATLCLVTIALFSRYMRSATLENLVQDYVRTAQSKGVSPRRVLFVHVLRNALLPIVTLIGLSLPGILSGALVTESLFNYPGIGYLFWQAAQTDDFPVEIGVTLVVAVGVVLGSLLADILYAVLDPRVRYS
ncbi:MAG TPA: ABC transporter permease [Candidatus Dormibacteraeota bacterium]|nr:ABC transporter permease [Candidatus Dormibacteraeota bacterium]